MSLCYNTEYDCKIFKFLCNQIIRKVVFMTHELVSATLPVWSIIPFAGMLLSIAIVPLVRPEWWEKHMLGAAFAWSLLFLIPFAAADGVGESWFRLLESVTAEECRRFAAENLCREKLAMSIIEPKSAPTGTEETE